MALLANLRTIVSVSVSMKMHLKPSIFLSINKCLLSKLFAILFFFMLFILGVGCLVALVACAYTVVMDSFPTLRIWHVSLGSCIVGFLIGLVYTTPGGQWIFTMIDFFGGTFIFFVLTIFEIVSISWWYGLEEICLDIEFMSKRKPGFYWRFCWGILIPIILTSVLIYFIYTLEPLKYENKDYPANIIVWGWLLLGFGAIQPILWFIVEILRKKRNVGWELAYKSMFLHENWKPAKFNDEWRQFKQKAKIARNSKNNHWIVDKLLIVIGR